jgi:hypothetical protein
MQCIQHLPQAAPICKETMPAMELPSIGDTQVDFILGGRVFCFAWEEAADLT